MKCQKQAFGCSVKKIFWKFSQNHKKAPALESLFNIWLQILQRRCFPANLSKFYEHLCCRTSRNGCFWNVKWLVSWKSFWVILGETVQSSSISFVIMVVSCCTINHFSLTKELQANTLLNRRPWLLTRNPS